MPETDPLALRHGAMIMHIWTLIGQARFAAMRMPTTDQAASYLEILRHQRRLLHTAQRAEARRQEFSVDTIDDWFAPVDKILARAEAHFQGIIAAARRPDATAA